MKRLGTPCMLVIAILALAFIPAVTASAAESSAADPWEFHVTLYLWGASIGGQSASGSDIEVEFGDLFSNLEMAFMGGFGARKGRWSFTADIIYVDVGDDETISGIPVGVDLSNWVVTPTIGYTATRGEWGNLDVLAGARYLSLDSELRVGPYRAEPSGDHWDAIIGVRGKVNFTEHWHLPFHLDIGTGETDFTWQGLVGIGYSFTSVDLVAGYRYLQWDFDNSTAIDDLDYSGPFGGIKIRF